MPAVRGSEDEVGPMVVPGLVLHGSQLCQRLFSTWPARHFSQLAFFISVAPPLRVLPLRHCCSAQRAGPCRLACSVPVAALRHIAIRMHKSAHYYLSGSGVASRLMVVALAGA